MMLSENQMKFNISMSESWKRLSFTLLTREPVCEEDNRAASLISSHWNAPRYWRYRHAGVQPDPLRKLWSSFEVCFPSSCLVTLQRQLDGFICRTGGWWGLAWCVWTSDLLTKKRAIVVPGRKAARLFSEAWNLSLLGELCYNFSRLQSLSDLYETFEIKSTLDEKRLVYKSHHVEADFPAVDVHLETVPAYLL